MVLSMAEMLVRLNLLFNDAVSTETTGRQGCSGIIRPRIRTKLSLCTDVSLICLLFFTSTLLVLGALRIM
jgi:hypothetical protein